MLNRYQIKAELTSTKRVGFHRYTYGENIALLFNLNGQKGPSFMSHGEIQQTENTNLITGQVTNQPTFRRPKPSTVYFCSKIQYACTKSRARSYFR